MPIRVAIDGPASSGKGTVAHAVARALGYAHVDTGALYRAVALAAQRAGVSWDEGVPLGALVRSLPLSVGAGDGEQRVRIGAEDVTTLLRSAELGAGASAVARHVPVREGLLALQRRLASDGGVVMDGRDIGTVVLPDAELKIYLDADVTVRAQRRAADLAARGQPIALAEVEANLRARDAQDMSREVAPLRCAADAVVVDTTTLDVGASVAEVLRLARALGA